jgi:hypothetical protein
MEKHMAKMESRQKWAITAFVLFFALVFVGSILGAVTSTKSPSEKLVADVQENMKFLNGVYGPFRF